MGTKNRGQVLAEAVWALALLTLVFLSLTGLLAARWRQAQAAVLAFEAARARMYGIRSTRALPPGFRAGCQISREDFGSEQVEVIARCGGARERVRLWRFSETSAGASPL